MVQISAVFLFLIGVIVGVLIGVIGMVIIALNYKDKGDSDNGRKEKRN